MPCLRETDNLVFGQAGLVEEPEPSEAIENERRLFYVALTRAKKAVYVGTVAPPSNGASPRLPSRFLDEILLTPTVHVSGSPSYVAADAAVGDGSRDWGFVQNRGNGYNTQR